MKIVFGLYHCISLNYKLLNVLKNGKNETFWDKIPTKLGNIPKKKTYIWEKISKPLNNLLTQIIHKLFLFSNQIIVIKQVQDL